MSTWAVVVAGGRGVRFGRLKQFERLAGRRVIDWSTDAAREVADGVVIVLPSGVPLDTVEADAVVVGGATRSASVRAGLAAVPPGTDIVVVHDAARPLAREPLFRAVIGAVTGACPGAGGPGVGLAESGPVGHGPVGPGPVAGAVPALALTETVKRVSGSLVVATVDRQELVTVQTPQAFLTEVLLAAHRSGAEGTDDAALVEAIGGSVVTVPGDPANLKLTAPSDLALAAVLLGA